MLKFINIFLKFINTTNYLNIKIYIYRKVLHFKKGGDMEIKTEIILTII